MKFKKFSQSYGSFFTASKDFESFAIGFARDPSVYTRTHFNSLFNSLNLKQKKSHNTIKELNSQTLIEEWQAYLENPSPSDLGVKKIIRKGLSTTGLEFDQEFQALMARQQPQKKLFEWLYSYVIRLQILDTNFNFQEDFWIKLVVQWSKQLKQDHIRNFAIKETILKEFHKKFKNRHKEYLRLKVESIIASIGEPINIEIAVSSALEREFKVNFFSTDYIYQICLGKIFETRVEAYLNQRDSSSDLLRLLNSFCILNHEKAYQRFTYIFNMLINSIKSFEKETIKAFVKKQLGDPRIKKNNWENLKRCDKDVFSKILFWFNEADFDLFFEFVFAGKSDEHGRKECWQRYISYADDIRIFLPSRVQINEFKAVAEKSNNESALEPIENLSRLTSFIIKINRILIFETVETRNSAYIYNMDSDDLGTPKTYAAKKVIEFYRTLFESDLIPNSINATNCLTFTDLAPDDGKNAYNFYSQDNWRFTHDRDHKWHDAVETMMKQLHGLSPKVRNND